EPFVDDCEPLRLISMNPRPRVVISCAVVSATAGAARTEACAKAAKPPVAASISLRVIITLLRGAYVALAVAHAQVCSRTRAPLTQVGLRRMAVLSVSHDRQEGAGRAH